MKSYIFNIIKEIFHQEDNETKILDSRYRIKLSYRIFGYSVAISSILCFLIFALQFYKLSLLSELNKLNDEEVYRLFKWLAYLPLKTIHILGLDGILQKKDFNVNLFVFIIDWAILCFLFYIPLYKYYHNKPKKYLPCPYCKKSIKVFINWRCDHCYNDQGEERYITKKCKECERFLDTAICEHCGGEFKL